jgi:hypothetical protein
LHKSSAFFVSKILYRKNKKYSTTLLKKVSICRITFLHLFGLHASTCGHPLSVLLLALLSLLLDLQTSYGSYSLAVSRELLVVEIRNSTGFAVRRFFGRRGRFQSWVNRQRVALNNEFSS